jgi:hypothetical protein
MLRLSKAKANRLLIVNWLPASGLERSEEDVRVGQEAEDRYNEAPRGLNCRKPQRKRG